MAAASAIVDAVARCRTQRKLAIDVFAIRVFGSSVGTKLLIGITGLALFVYLVIHIAGNLLVFFGPATFNKYAYTLEGEPAAPGHRDRAAAGLPGAHLQDGDDVLGNQRRAAGRLREEEVRRAHRAARASPRRR